MSSQQDIELPGFCSLSVFFLAVLFTCSIRFKCLCSFQFWKGKCLNEMQKSKCKTSNMFVMFAKQYKAQRLEHSVLLTVTEWSSVWKGSLDRFAVWKWGILGWYLRKFHPSFLHQDEYKNANAFYIGNKKESSWDIVSLSHNSLCAVQVVMFAKQFAQRNIPIS